MTSLQIKVSNVADEGAVGQDEKASNMSFNSSPTATNNDTEFEAQSVSQNLSPTGPWKLRELLRRLVSWHRKSADNVVDLSATPRMDGVRQLDYCPKGYPKAAAFLDSDENFMIFRRFGFLQARLLLQKQDELRKLEENLDQYDDNEDDPRKLHSCQMDSALGGKRHELLKTIERKFHEYGELLCLAHKLVAFSRPSSLNYTSVKNWFDIEQPFVEREYYVHHKEDVITLKPGRENAWLDGFVESVLQRLNCRLIRYIFRSPETRAKTSGREVYFTKRRVDLLVTLIITAMVLVLLIVPVYLLWHLSEETQTNRTNSMTVGILLSFTLIFSAVLSFFTKAQRHEILGAAAAYCAVLVVFISNVGNNGSASAVSFKSFDI